MTYMSGYEIIIRKAKCILFESYLIFLVYSNDTHTLKKKKSHFLHITCMSCSWLVLINSKFKIFINLELKKNFFIFLFYFIDFFLLIKLQINPEWIQTHVGVSPQVFFALFRFPKMFMGSGLDRKRRWCRWGFLWSCRVQHCMVPSSVPHDSCSSALQLNITLPHFILLREVERKAMSLDYTPPHPREFIHTFVMKLAALYFYIVRWTINSTIYWWLLKGETDR